MEGIDRSRHYLDDIIQVWKPRELVAVRAVVKVQQGFDLVLEVEQVRGLSIADEVLGPIMVTRATTTASCFLSVPATGTGAHCLP